MAYMVLGRVIGNMAKGYIKSQAKKKASKFLDKIIRSGTSNRIFKTLGNGDTFVFFKSDKSKISINDLNSDYNALKRFHNLGYSKHIKEFLDKSDSVSNRVGNVINDPLDKIYANINMNKFDRVIFEIGQRNVGVITRENLYSDAERLFKDMYGNTKMAEELHKAFINYAEYRIDSFTRLGLLNFRSGGYFEVTDRFMTELDKRALLTDFKFNIPDPEFKLNNYHYYILENAIKDNGIDLNKKLMEFKQELRVENSEVKMKAFSNVLESLAGSDMIKNEDGKFRVLDNNVYEILQKKNYDIKLIKDDIIDPNNFYESFKKQPKLEDPEKKLKSLQFNCDKLVNQGFLKYENGRYTILEKSTYEIFQKRDLDVVEKSIYKHSLENSGVIDKDKLVMSMISDKDTLAKLNKMHIDKKADSFILGFQDYEVLFSEFKNGKLNVDELKVETFMKYKNQDEAEAQFNKLYLRLQGNSDNGFLDFNKETNTYKITEKGYAEAAKSKAEFNFCSYDANVIFNYINMYDGKINEKHISDALNESLTDKKNVKVEFERITSRMNECAAAGYLKIDTNGDYSISDKGFKRLSESFLEKKQEMLERIKNDNVFLSEVCQKFTDNKVKEFVFGKYDANVIFSEFKENSITLSELKETLIERFSDGASEDAIKQFDIISKRLEKLVDNGYVDYNKDTLAYSISDKGIEQAKLVADTFQFTAYDANVVFSYVSKSGGSIDSESLLSALRDEYKDPRYVNDQHKYLLKRMDSNVEAGYMSKSDTGIYTLSDKGKEKLYENVESLKADIDKKIEYLTNCGMLSKVNDMIKTTDLYKEIVDRRLSYSDKIMFSMFTRKSEIPDAVFSYIPGKAFDVKQLNDSFNEYIYNRYGFTRKADELIHEFQEDLKDRLNSLCRIEYLKLDEEKYVVTDNFIAAYEKQGALKEFGLNTRDVELTNFHVGLLSHAARFDKLNVEHYFNIYFNNDKVMDIENKQYILDKTCEKLAFNGYLKFTDDSYVLTEKGIKEMYFAKEFDNLEKAILDFGSNKDYKFKYNDFVQEIIKDKSLVENINKMYPDLRFNQPFVFKKYDSFVLYKEFYEKINSFTEDEAFLKMKNEYPDISKKSYRFQNFKNVLEEDIKKGNVVYDEISGVFKFLNDENQTYRIYSKEYVSLTPAQLRDNLYNRFTDSDEAEKTYNMMIKRIDKHIENGFISVDQETGEMRITPTGEAKAKEVSRIFEFSTYDANVLFDYIERSGGMLSMDKLKELLMADIKDIGKVDEKLKYLESRLEKNVKINTVSKSADGCYYITENGFAKKMDVLYKDTLERLDIKLKELVNTELLNFSDSVYSLNDRFYEVNELLHDKDIVKTSFKLTNLDRSIIKEAIEKPLNVEDKRQQLLLKFPEKPRVAISQFNMWYSRCDRLRVMGLLKFNDYSFSTTSLGKQFLGSNLEVPNSRKKFSVKLSAFDISLFKRAISGPINMDDLKAELLKKYSQKPSEADRQYKIWAGRLVKFEIDGYFKKTDSIYEITDKGRTLFSNAEEVKNKLKEAANHQLSSVSNFDISIVKKLHSNSIDVSAYKDELLLKYGDSSTFNVQYKKFLNSCNKLCNAGYASFDVEHDSISITDKGNEFLEAKYSVVELDAVKAPKDPESIFKLTKFDYDNFVTSSKDNVWSKDVFISSNSSLSDELLSKKIASAEKRLDVLLKMKLVLPLENGTFEIDKSFVERSRSFYDKEKYVFSLEQKEMLSAMKDFLNFTDYQVGTYFYPDKDVLCRSDLKQLISKGYLKCESRDLYNDGCFTKVYYLTPKGKKAASHLTGTEINRIYSSKIHNRPEELKHDLLVFSAYKDFESKVTAGGFKITNFMTDKQMRSFDMLNGGIQRVEYSDLYIELEDVKTGEKGFVNLEVDCGYKPNVIASKADNLENLVWYTDSSIQAERISKTIENSKVMMVSF